MQKLHFQQSQTGEKSHGSQRRAEMGQAIHESRESLEIYSQLSITEAQQHYDQVMGKFPVQ
ncbi:MAG: hypothetical protein M3Z24_01045 [Chloroflexota bacterium]|nr:hypothetical protein [Chloroflexota bacterium]